MPTPRIAPALQVSQWLNTAEPLTLDGLRGKVVVVSVFQMLCSGCVHHSIPLTKRLYETFDPAEVTVLGLHSVFEHHEVMTPAALAVFVREQGLAFPVGIDESSEDNDIPRTMRAYQMQGTPTTILIDTAGRLRMQSFGSTEAISLAASIGILLGEARAETGNKIL